MDLKKLIKEELLKLQKISVLKEQKVQLEKELEQLYETKDVYAMYKKAGLEPPHPGKGIHTKKFHKCVTSVGDEDNKNPYAICMAKLGKEKAVKASHRTDENFVYENKKGILSNKPGESTEVEIINRKNGQMWNAIVLKDGGIYKKGDKVVLDIDNVNFQHNINESESKKPIIFQYTTYRNPTEKELIEVDSCNLNAEDILNGFCYTIVGKGFKSAENIKMIVDSIEKLCKMFPNKEQYKKALEDAKLLKPKQFKI